MKKVYQLLQFSFLLVSINFISNQVYSQTNQCNNNIGGEVAVNGSCITSVFSTNTNNNYWSGTDFSCNSTDQDDKWVWFTATATSTTITYNSASDAVLHLFEGAGCNVNMVPVDCADNTVTGDETITYATTIGIVYHVRVQQWNSNATMNGTICVYSGGGGGGGADAAWPGSDLGTLTCPATTSVSDNTTGANIDCLTSFTGDHIYQFTLATASDITIDVCGASWDTYLSLYNLASGDCDGVAIQTDDDGCGTLQSTMTSSCLAAGTYVVVVQGFAEGAYTLNLTTSNCACIGGGGGADTPWPGSDLGSLTCPSTTSVSDNTTGANIDCLTSFSGDHIYQFTLAAASDITIDVCGATWDTYLSLYNLASGDCDGVAIQTDDDGCGTVQSTMTRSCLVAGTYVVVVQGFAEGAYTLNLTTSNCACTPTITASDCSDAVNICTNANFIIDPNGIGAINEIPASGSLGNPLYDGFAAPWMPWTSTNMGCLQTGENNSTWMIINISGTGDLEFTFGGAGTQGGFYDWVMYPYTASSCTDIPANTVAPVRCNWNGVDNGGTGLCYPCCLPAGGDATNFEPELPVIAGEQYIICFSNYSAVSTAVPLDFSGTATVSCTPLAIELLEFNAEAINYESQINPKIKVFWGTVAEMDNDYYTVERSIYGVNFEAIGKVEGAGNSSRLIYYEFIDQNPESGINYYRLKQTDYDGMHEYSSIISVESKGISFLKIYPNPANNRLMVNGITPGDEIQIYNVLGEIVYEQKFNNKKETIILDEFIGGTYIIKIIGNDRSIVEKLIIEH